MSSAAAAVRPETVAQLSTPDAHARESAFRRFVWQVRWPTLLSACAMLAATYALEHLGGQSHAYTWEEFVARYEQNFGALTEVR